MVAHCAQHHLASSSWLKEFLSQGAPNVISYSRRHQNSKIPKKEGTKRAKESEREEERKKEVELFIQHPPPDRPPPEGANIIIISSSCSSS